jgi:hypothetical protein
LKGSENMEIKRNPLFVLIIILMCLSLFGCSSKEPGRYYDKGCSIKFPEGWEEREVDIPIPGLIVYVKDPEDVAKIALFMTEFEQEVTYDEYIQEELNRLKSSGADVHEEEETTLDGSRAHRAIISELPFAKITLSYTIIKENKVYRIAFVVSDPDLFSSYEDTFEKVASSFRFE